MKCNIMGHTWVTEDDTCAKYHQGLCSSFICVFQYDDIDLQPKTKIFFVDHNMLRGLDPL